jgi:hypothetical protein
MLYISPAFFLNVEWIPASTGPLDHFKHVTRIRHPERVNRHGH